MPPLPPKKRKRDQHVDMTPLVDPNHHNKVWVLYEKKIRAFTGRDMPQWHYAPAGRLPSARAVYWALWQMDCAVESFRVAHHVFYQQMEYLATQHEGHLCAHLTARAQILQKLDVACSPPHTAYL